MIAAISVSHFKCQYTYISNRFFIRLLVAYQGIITNLKTKWKGCAIYIFNK